MSPWTIKFPVRLFAPMLLLTLLLQGCAQQPAAGGQIEVNAGSGPQTNDANLSEGTPPSSQQGVESATVLLMAKYGKKQERPQVRVLADTKSLKAHQAAIYGKAEDGMLLVAWKDLLVIYDPKSGNVVQELAINTFEG